MKKEKFLAILKHIDENTVLDPSRPGNTSLSKAKKKGKAAYISSCCNELILDIKEHFNNIIENYLEMNCKYECHLWEQQAAEAKAFIEDSTAPTPLLDIMVSVSGEDKTGLVNKIALKHEAWIQFYGTVISNQNKYINQIRSVDTSKDDFNDQVEYLNSILNAALAFTI